MHRNFFFWVITKIIISKIENKMTLEGECYTLQGHFFINFLIILIESVFLSLLFLVFINQLFIIFNIILFNFNYFI